MPSVLDNGVNILNSLCVSWFEVISANFLFYIIFVYFSHVLNVNLRINMTRIYVEKKTFITY